MSEQKKNEILEEQRKARQEFLTLKKIQNGEMKAPPKPSEMAILPKTGKEKAANFWFQYKWVLLAGVAVAVILAVLITQCATRVKYDLEVVYFSYTGVTEAQTEAVARYFEQFAEDVDGNGEVHVQVINCSMSKDSGNQQYAYTVLTKLQAIIAGDQKALLYITDGDSFQYLNEISQDSDLFEGNSVTLGEEFYRSTEVEVFGRLPEGLQISRRRVAETTLEGKKGVKEVYEASGALLNALATPS